MVIVTLYYSTELLSHVSHTLNISFFCLYIIILCVIVVHKALRTYTRRTREKTHKKVIIKSSASVAEPVNIASL